MSRRVASLLERSLFARASRLQGPKADACKRLPEPPGRCSVARRSPPRPAPCPGCSRGEVGGAGVGREGSNGRASGRRPHMNLTFPSSLARGARAVAAAAAAAPRPATPGEGVGLPGKLRGGALVSPRGVRLHPCTPSPIVVLGAQVRLPRGGASHPACIPGPSPGLELEPSCTSLQVGNILEDITPHPPPPPGKRGTPPLQVCIDWRKRALPPSIAGGAHPHPPFPCKGRWRARRRDWQV